MRHKLLLLLVLFFLAVCTGLFVLFSAAAKTNAVRVLNEELALHARQAAQGIEEFFAGWTGVANSLARIEAVIDLDEDGKKYMALFQESHSDQVRAITRVSAAGRILHTVPLNSNVIGNDISYQPHVREILRDRRPVVSDVFRAVQGYDAVALHVPVFKGDAFDGTLAVVVNFETLAKRYFSVISTGRTGQAWVVSRDGTMLFSPEPGRTGKSVFESFQDAPSVLRVAAEMLRGNSGETSYMIAPAAGGKTAAARHFAVYMPIRFGTTFWSIIVSSPENEVLASLVSFRNRLALIMSLLLVGGTGFAFLGVKAWLIVREEEKRRRVEEALRESEERFRELADSLPQTVFETDPGGRVRYANKAGFASFGYTAEDLARGLSMFELLVPADRDRAQQNVGARFRGELAAQEYLGLRKDGSTFPVIAHTAPILRGGLAVGLRGLVVDITDRRLLEEERLKSAKLEAIGTLAGGIAHDFNNLLQSIFGCISVAKQSLDRSAAAFCMLEQAESALRQSVGLTNQLLTFSKGGKPLKQVLSLRPVIENAAKFALSGSRIGCRLAVESGLTAVEADEGQLAQVIQNIVLNAAQAMPQGGEVEIAARNARAPGPGVPAQLPPGTYAAVSIRDTGSGIAAENLPRIFDPYFTTKEKGTGLGLASSYSIIRNHGGVIVAESQPGRGSLFTFFIPGTTALPVDPGVPPPAPAAVATPATPAAKILLMDDEEMVRGVTAEMMRILGHEVVAVSDGKDAVVEYQAAKDSGRPFDLALLDLTIRGGMGGEETLRALQAIDPGVRAVVASGYVESSSIAEYQARGFKACLRKPFQIESLNAVLSPLLRERAGAG